MSKLSEYQDKYETARFERSDDGILQVTLHADGGPWQMGRVSHDEMPEIFRDVAEDLENEVLILAGTGDEWSGPLGYDVPFPRSETKQWEYIQWVARALMENYLAIPVPVIAAVNGPARRQAQIPLLADIVLASETADFQDSSHFPNSGVPGDGQHIAMLRLLGLNRGRYYLLTGQVITAQEALELGLVAEVLPADQLLPRAWELARLLMEKNRLVRRYTRTLMVHEVRGALHDLLGYGLALEGLGSVDHSAELNAADAAAEQAG